MGSAMHAADTPTACENCGTVLQGTYCHACGQNSHNPLRNVAHAIEDVFESFWHLDGRVFRTLRDLLFPGRVACNYLAGQRVRYIPPLRLFVVLTVLTFFVGRLVYGAPDGGVVRIGGNETPTKEEIRFDKEPGTTFEDAKTIEDVVRQRDKALEGIAEGQRAVGMLPIAAQGMQRAEAKVRADAEIRIAQLRAQGATEAPAAVNGDAGKVSTDARTPTTAAAGTAPTSPATEKRDATSTPEAAASTRDEDEDKTPDVEGGIDKFVRGMSTATLRDPTKRWHPETNPADVNWLPAFGDRLFNHKLETIAKNFKRYTSEEGNFLKAFVAALPTALFLMMPVFALLLRLFYIRRRHGVLEHLVVALYSHAFLLMAMMAIFLLWGIGSSVVQPLGALFYLLMTFVMIYIPVYLLIMQKRVYGQGWPKTIVKYLLIGGAYQFLLGFAATFAALLPFLGGE